MIMQRVADIELALFQCSSASQEFRKRTDERFHGASGNWP